MAGPGGNVIHQLEDLGSRVVNLRNHILRTNIYLVGQAAKTYVKFVPDLDALISEGTQRLMRAVELFDFTRGTEFRAYVARALMRTFSKFSHKESESEESLQGAAEDMIETSPGEGSLNEEGKDSLIELGGRRLTDALRILSQRERDVIVARFGLGSDGKRATLEETGSILGLSRTRVHQIEAQALEKLRQDLKWTLPRAP